MRTKTIDPLVSNLIESKLDRVRSGETITMQSQCGMSAIDAITWQAAMILEGRRSIITRSQTKLSKANGSEWINRGLTLSPANEASDYFVGKFNHCPFATVSCIFACVGSATGQGALPSSKIARIGRTLAMHHNFDAWFSLLRSEINKELAKCMRLEKKTGKKHKLAFRTNVASDNVTLADDLCNSFPDSAPIEFYDYTVIPKAVGSSYVQRVYSRKENNHDQCLEILESGYGIAVVFVGAIPARWNGYPVIDGDVNDLWFTRAPEHGGFVVGLKVKGSNKQKQACINSGFAVDVRA